MSTATDGYISYYRYHCTVCNRGTSRKEALGGECPMGHEYKVYGPYEKPNPKTPKRAYRAGSRPKVTMHTKWEGSRAQKAAAKVFALFGDRCHICHRGGADTVDHLRPRWQHPELTWCIANMRPAHRACNQRRAALTSPGSGRYRRHRPAQDTLM